jgi:DNA-binding PadR family transcriptional regulator
MQGAVLSEVVEDEVAKDIQARMVRNFLDVVILKELRTKPLSGYDVIEFIHKKFDILLSSGTVYSVIYSLERNGLIKAVWHQRRRDYVLTEKGKETTRIILNTRDRIRALTSNVF